MTRKMKEIASSYGWRQDAAADAAIDALVDGLKSVDEVLVARWAATALAHCLTADFVDGFDHVERARMEHSRTRVIAGRLERAERMRKVIAREVKRRASYSSQVSERHRDVDADLAVVIEAARERVRVHPAPPECLSCHGAGRDFDDNMCASCGGTGAAITRATGGEP